MLQDRFENADRCIAIPSSGEGNSECVAEAKIRGREVDRLLQAGHRCARLTRPHLKQAKGVMGGGTLRTAFERRADGAFGPSFVAPLAKEIGEVQLRFGE